MKKLMLLAAILTVGTMATAEIGVGKSYKGGDPTPNNYSGNAGDFRLERDITTNDSSEHNNKNGEGSRVNIFRDKGNGWEDDAKTKVVLKVIQPIKMTAESDKIYTESVKGDELQIGDIGFKVTGERDAVVSFKFKGDLFKHIKGEAKVRGLDQSFFPITVAKLGENSAQTIQEDVKLKSGVKHNLEVDLYFNLKGVKPGIKSGIILATAEYK